MSEYYEDQYKGIEYDESKNPKQYIIFFRYLMPTYIEDIAKWYITNFFSGYFIWLKIRLWDHCILGLVLLKVHFGYSFEKSNLILFLIKKYLLYTIC